MTRMTSKNAPFEERFYAWLVSLSTELDGYRLDTLETFRDLHREAVTLHGRWAAWALFLRSASTLLALVASERRRALVDTLSPSPTPLHRRLPDMLTNLGQDLRFAFRHLGRRPTFACAVVIITAFGVGATTSVFSVVDHVLLRSLPYPQQEQLMYFSEGSHPGLLFKNWRENSRSFQSIVAVWGNQPLDLTGDGPPQELRAAGVSEGFFEMFGAQAQRGRLFGLDDFRPGQRVVLLDPGLWRQRWGADPEIVGQTLTLDGEPWTIIGVLGSEFTPPEAMVGHRVDLWKPLDMQHPWLQEWPHHLLSVVGRLHPETSQQAAQAELDALADRLADQEPTRRSRKDDSPIITPLISLYRATVGEVHQSLYLLLGAVGLLLLIGCANIANLFLARGTDRHREMSLRAALGARRGRLAGQLLTESLVLSLTGGALGTLLAYGLVEAFALWLPRDLPRLAAVSVDPRLLAFALGVSLFTGLLFGLFPALQASRVDVGDAMRAGTGRSTNGQGFGLRNALVIIEVAFTLILLVGAGLLFNSLVRQLETPLGFETADLIRLELNLGGDVEDENRPFFVENLLERLEAVPGIEAVAGGWTLPFDDFGNSRCCWWSSLLSDGPDAEPQSSMIHPITPGFFQVLGARWLAGRPLTATDAQATEALPVVLNKELATSLFGEENAVGQRLTLGRSEPRDLEVVGVVENLRHFGFRAEPGHAVYLPYGAVGAEIGQLRLALRTHLPWSAALANTVRDAIWELDPNLPVSALAPLDSQISLSLHQPRFHSLLLGSFAFLSLLLAAAGVASSLFYTVGRRTRELGIRLALGARGQDLRRLVLSQGLSLVAVGLALGLAGAALLSRYLKSMIHGIPTTDPATFASVSLLLILVALFAADLPARRAARTNPAVTLRAD